VQEDRGGDEKRGGYENGNVVRGRGGGKVGEGWIENKDGRKRLGCEGGNMGIVEQRLSSFVVLLGNFLYSCEVDFGCLFVPGMVLGGPSPSTPLLKEGWVPSELKTLPEKIFFW